MQAFLKYLKIIYSEVEETDYEPFVDPLTFEAPPFS